MPSFCAISSADSPDPRRKALSRLPISSKRRGMGCSCTPRRHCRARPGNPCSIEAYAVCLYRYHLPHVSMGPGVKPGGDNEFASGARLQLSLPAQPLRRIERGDDDVLIAGAAAQIAGNADTHFLFGRIRIVAQELD